MTLLLTFSRAKVFICRMIIRRIIVPTYIVVCYLSVSLVVPALSLAGVPSLAEASEVLAVMKQQNTTGHEHDYFDPNADEAHKQLLRQVESFHLNKKFFENIAKGIYKYPLQDIDFILEYFPNHPTGLQLLTSVAMLSKKKSLPIRYFEKAIALYPSHAITYAQYGWYYVTIGRLEMGVQRLKDAVRMEPELIAAYVWLAHAYERKGELQLAREAAEHAKELGYGEKVVDPGAK